MTRFTSLLALSLLLSNTFYSVLGNDNVEVEEKEEEDEMKLVHPNVAYFAESEPEECAGKAKQNACHSPWTSKHCKYTCLLHDAKTYSYQRYHLEDTSVDLYDLTAKNATGHTIDFERFEGYVTLVAPMAKICNIEDPILEDWTPGNIIDRYSEIRKVNNVAIEIVLFPFNHPEHHNFEGDCDEYEHEFVKKGRNVHVMEHAEVNGENTHPVFERFKKAMQMNTMDLDNALYFIIHPSFETIDIHWGKSIIDMRHVLKQLVNEIRDEL